MIPRRQFTRAIARRPAPIVPRCQRLSTTTSGSKSSSGSATSHLSTSFIGGLAGAALFFTIYSYTPAGRTASTVNKALGEAAQKYDLAAKKLQEKTPTADEAVDSIKQFAYSYVAWVPGGREYVDIAFKDWEAVRKNHKDEADKIVNDAYKELQQVSKGGLSLETASKALEVLADLSRKIGNLSAEAFTDVLDNHPQLKEKFGSSVDQLKAMGEKYGPEAKKKVEETWDELKGMLAGGFSVANMDKVRRLLEEKTQQVKKMGDDAWKKALEEAKPVLDKNPEAKKLIEENADVLKKGNFKEVLEKAKSAVESGNLEDLQKYVISALKGKSGTKGSKSEDKSEDKSESESESKGQSKEDSQKKSKKD